MFGRYIRTALEHREEFLFVEQYHLSPVISEEGRIGTDFRLGQRSLTELTRDGVLRDLDPLILDAVVLGTANQLLCLHFAGHLALDDAAHWDRYAVATPAGRRGVVAGKYVFTLLVIVVSVAVAAGLMVCLSLAGLTETTLDDLVLIALSCGVLTLVLDAIILPFLLKYGAEKARVISMITFVVIFGGAVLLGGLAKNQITLPTPPAWLLTALPVLLGLLAIGGYLISYFIAQEIYAKKEF